MGIEKRLQIAGVLLMLGLMIEAVCLLWARPVAFIVMVCVGGLFCGIGAVVYLCSLVSARQE